MWRPKRVQRSRAKCHGRARVVIMGAAETAGGAKFLEWVQQFVEDSTLGAMWVSSHGHKGACDKRFPPHPLPCGFQRMGMHPATRSAVISYGLGTGSSGRHPGPYFWQCCPEVLTILENVAILLLFFAWSEDDMDK